MNCPVCNIPLKQISCENQEINLCTKCGGVWFDKGELLKVVNSLLDKNKVDPQSVIEAHSKEIIDSKSIKQLTRNCPRCQTEMQMYNFFYDSNIFFGNKLKNVPGIRFRYAFNAPVIKKPTPGIFIVFMGWFLLLLPIIYKILAAIGLFD